MYRKRPFNGGSRGDRKMSSTPPTKKQIAAMYKDIPKNCTLCGGSFEIDGKRVIYPYPIKHWLCRTCFTKSLDAGLGRLNKVLAGQPLTKEDFQSTNESQKTEDTKE